MWNKFPKNTITDSADTISNSVFSCQSCSRNAEKIEQTQKRAAVYARGHRGRAPSEQPSWLTCCWKIEGSSSQCFHLHCASAIISLDLLFFCLFSQGYSTMQLVCSQEMHNLGYAWRTIKEQLGDEIESHIHRMTFLKGRAVCTHNICIYEMLLLFRSALKTYICYNFPPPPMCIVF